MDARPTDAGEDGRTFRKGLLGRLQPVPGGGERGWRWRGAVLPTLVRWLQPCLRALPACTGHLSALTVPSSCRIWSCPSALQDVLIVCHFALALTAPHHWSLVTIPPGLGLSREAAPADTHSIHRLEEIYYEEDRVPRCAFSTLTQEGCWRNSFPVCRPENQGNEGYKSPFRGRRR